MLEMRLGFKLRGLECGKKELEYFLGIRELLEDVGGGI